MRSRALLLAPVLVLVVAAAPAQAGNLLANGTFDTGLQSWNQFGSAVWDSTDALGRPTSGSVRGTNSSSGSFTYEVVVLSSCIPVSPGARLDGSFDYLVPTGQGLTLKPQLEISWYNGPGCGGLEYVASNLLVQGDDTDGLWHRLEAPGALQAPATATHVSLRVELVKIEAGGAGIAYFDNVVFKAEGSCGSTPDRLCLRNDRFEVSATYLDYQGHHGPALAEAMTSDTGYFWFFTPANVEVVLKVIDGCSYNSAFWIYAGGLTDVEVKIDVKDVPSGAVKHYSNPLGTPFAPIGDIQGLTTCP